MLEGHFRHYYQRALVDPLAMCLCRLGWARPAWVSLAGLILGLLTIPFLAFGHSYWAVLMLVLSGYCDTLDGTLARLGKRTSDKGAFLDVFFDRLVEFAVLLGLLLVNPAARSFWCFLMLGSILICITSFLLVSVFSKNESQKSFHYSRGLIERPEAFIFFALMMLLPHFFVILAASFTFLVFYTAFLRVFQFLKMS